METKNKTKWLRITERDLSNEVSTLKNSNQSINLSRREAHARRNEFDRDRERGKSIKEIQIIAARNEMNLSPFFPFHSNEHHAKKK